MPNNRYQRGARAERELLNKFYEEGWAVIRSSGSGVNALSPDVVAVKNKLCIAFECKAWNKGSLSIEPEQFDKILEWERASASHTFVAWRVNNKGWFFIKTSEFTKGGKNYNVTLRRTFTINRLFKDILLLAPAPDGSEKAGVSHSTESAAEPIPPTGNGIEPSLI